MFKKDGHIPQTKTEIDPVTQNDRRENQCCHGISCSFFEQLGF